MKNSTYKINKYPQYTIEYYNDILDITDPAGNTQTVNQLIRSYRPGVTLNVGVSVKF